MSSKRMFSWSKRQSAADPYYRTGGLLSIEASPDVSITSVEAKVTPKSGQGRPSDLKIVTTDNKQFCLSPRSASYNFALTSAASNLQSVFNDLLRSPAPCAVERPLSASIHKPLPGRPRSVSLPSTPDLPAELPGSILLENQGFPPCTEPAEPVSVRPVSQNIRRSTHPPDIILEDGEEFFELLKLFPEPLGHSKSVPDLTGPYIEMRAVRSGNALNSGATPKPSQSKVQHKKSLSETSSRRRSRTSLTTSPLATDIKITTCSSLPVGDSSNNSSSARMGANKSLQPSPLILEGQAWNGNIEHRGSRRNEHGPAITPTPTTTRSRQIEELKSTITTQDQTISTLQAQFASLRASHDSHVVSLTESHSAEVASLKNYARVLEEQLSHRPSLHHASSNNLLFVLDTTEPQTPTRDNTQHTADPDSAASTNSFQTAFEKQQRSPQRPRNSPEMENLKRKLSTTRRPETASRNLLPELNQYKQNNVALQKQIESLMAKLNESRKSERALRTSLEETKQTCKDWQGKAEEADKVAKKAQALQNTIDHLENRLEIANVEKLDAQEELFNVQARKSPFDFEVPKLQLSTAVDRDSKATRNAHLSMSTVFSSGSPISPENESQELSTLAAFIAHIERLQDQVRQKDTQISELEIVREQLRQKHDQLEQDHNALTLQMDIQNELLRKTRRTDKHIEQLRTAVIDRETIIDEKEKSIRVVERQLEYHKLLLQSQIRRHATLTLHAAVENDPLPELDTLAARKDIDRWIESLHQRLKREQAGNHGSEPVDPSEAQMIHLRQEIDFYVREIIYYKLDIRGYKSDIKKLKKITAQLSSFGSRASDLESDTSSLRPPVTPSRTRFPSATPELGASDVPSPVLAIPVSDSIVTDRQITPSPLGITAQSGTTPPKDENAQVSKRAPPLLDFQFKDPPQTPTRKKNVNIANGIDVLDPGVSPRSVVRLSPERRKPTPPSPNRMRFGDLLTTFPLSTPATPQKRDRTMSESTATIYKTARSPQGSQQFGGKVETAIEVTSFTNRLRSASLPEPSKGRTTPDRPPRPRYGLFESPRAKRTTDIGPSSPSHADVLVEATRHSLGQQSPLQSPRRSRNNSNVSSIRIAPPHISRDVRNSIASSSSHIPPPERKLSAASNSSIPFVIAMGSPHDPSLITPIAGMPPTSCSITRNAPLKINSTTSRTGVGGTMASSTPVTSPISPTTIAFPDPPTKSTATKPTFAAPASPARKLSLSRKQDDQTPGTPRTPSHVRNLSGSSIRTAIRLPKSRDKEKDAHRMRKDSIGMPRPLGSPFDIDRAASVGAGEMREEERYAHGVGEAI